MGKSCCTADMWSSILVCYSTAVDPAHAPASGDCWRTLPQPSDASCRSVVATAVTKAAELQGGSSGTLPHDRRAVGGGAKGKPPRLPGSAMLTGCCGGAAAGGPTLDSMLGDRMASTCAMAGWLSSSTLRRRMTLEDQRPGDMSCSALRTARSCTCPCQQGKMGQNFPAWDSWPAISMMPATSQMARTSTAAPAPA